MKATGNFIANFLVAMLIVTPILVAIAVLIWAALIIFRDFGFLWGSVAVAVALSCGFSFSFALEQAIKS